MITVTEVKISDPFTEAAVFISVFPDKKFGEVFKILSKEVYSIQHQLNRRLRMRPVPKIRFVEDRREAEAGKVEEILEKIKEKPDNE